MQTIIHIVWILAVSNLLPQIQIYFVNKNVSLQLVLIRNANPPSSFHLNLAITTYSFRVLSPIRFWTPGDDIWGNYGHFLKTSSGAKKCDLPKLTGSPLLFQSLAEVCRTVVRAALKPAQSNYSVLILISWRM